MRPWIIEAKDTQNNTKETQNDHLEIQIDFRDTQHNHLEIYDDCEDKNYFEETQKWLQNGIMSSSWCLSLSVWGSHIRGLGSLGSTPLSMISHIYRLVQFP